MDEKRPSRLAPAFIAFAVLLPMVLLAFYVAGYFWLGEYRQAYVTYAHESASISSYHASLTPTPGSSMEVGRRFHQQWQVDFYRPLAQFESYARGVQVDVTTSSQWDSLYR